ncbi:PREDICTED: beta-amylase 7-like [Ipomoea nil]|uniref:beta-amylase 7-like n=1 Tax=Ipomoea nil TaxID=35883 RepID=UPI000900D274|nr:PREDICTED: beta-amylase 7-like [Ipomoea nil]
MAAEMHRYITNEEDEEMGMDVKEEDDEDEEEEEEEKSLSAPATVGIDGGVASNNSSHRFLHHQQFQEQPIPQGGPRRSRPLEEKERTKLRERHRRAITAKILAGLRKYGNYNLRARADINEVISAVAREAGFVVLADGTTFPSGSHPQATRATGPSIPVVTSPSSYIQAQNSQPASLRAISSGCQDTVGYSAVQLKSVFMSTSSSCDAPPSASSQISSMVADGAGTQNDSFLGGSLDSNEQLILTEQFYQVVDEPTRLQELGFADTPYVPVYVMLPLGIINIKSELVDPDSVVKQLRILKSINVDGVMVDCWWGIVEAHGPKEYNWDGYKRLFQIVRELELKIQVVMSFHECGGNTGDDVCIPLPHWVAEIGRSNPDIYFTDRAGRRNPECLSWGVDKERIFKGRTALEVYYDYMRSFRVEFDEFFKDDVISMIEVGLGPCGELRYPSNPVKHGWRYPGVGEFQCYDQYLLKSLHRAAEERGFLFWARGPDNAGSYNSRPDETGFFCDGGDYDGYYGRFFLKWYCQILVDHVDRVLYLANLIFEGTCIAAKLSGIHWWYKTVSHAAELTAGYYNSNTRDGYAAILAQLKKHEATLKFTCSEMSTLNQHEEAIGDEGDPKSLAWQMLITARDACLPVCGGNLLPCHDRESYNYLLEQSKPKDDPDGHHFFSFTYLRLSPVLLDAQNFMEFERFVKQMHGEVVLDDI